MTNKAGWKTVYEGDIDSPGFGVVCDTCDLTYSSKSATYHPTHVGVRVYNTLLADLEKSYEMSVRVDILHDKHGVMAFLRDLPY